MIEINKKVNKLEKSISHLAKTVDNFPSLFDKTYDRIMEGVKESLITLANRIILAERKIISLTKRVTELEDRMDKKS